MTKEQEVLLLTVARILRGRLRDIPDGSMSPRDIKELDALDAALVPFDLHSEPRPDYEPPAIGQNLSGKILRSPT
jgi:hypothetical protein